MNTVAKSGTFVLNKGEPIHRWYAYVEGYSSCLVERELNALLAQGAIIDTVYDPFNGTGTTGLVAAMRGICPFYSESNPFMQFVAETKINSVVVHDPSEMIVLLNRYISGIRDILPSQDSCWDGFEKYFELRQLQQVLALKKHISSEINKEARDILMMALSAIIVRASKMTRRGDLRFATPSEYHPEDVFNLFVEKLLEIIEDLPMAYSMIARQLIKVSDDARDNDRNDFFDCVITSPPYLNGTNYIRNTKLELKLNGYVTTEKDLPSFHSKGIVAGINNVSKRNGDKPIIDELLPMMEEVCTSAYDERIPKMIAGYFYDMQTVIARLARSLKNGGYFIMDIGDSQFGGIHIPTHVILSEICSKYGFSRYSEEIIRERRSKNGMVLSQRILRFRLEK